jgi:hypothetical protein
MTMAVSQRGCNSRFNIADSLFPTWSYTS